MNRRQFVARTAALNVALSALPRAFAAPGRGSCKTQFERVVADTRFAPSVTFAATMAENGTRVSPTDGDLTSLWFDEFAGHFATSGAPVVGLTTARTALVMTELARGPGVRVLWRSEHTTMPNGSLRHELRGSASLVARAEVLRNSPDWIVGLASVLDELTAVEAGQTPNTSAVVLTARTDTSPEEPLTSWVLLPRRVERDRLEGVYTRNEEKQQ